MTQQTAKEERDADEKEKGSIIYLKYHHLAFIDVTTSIRFFHLAVVVTSLLQTAVMIQVSGVFGKDTPRQPSRSVACSLAGAIKRQKESISKKGGLPKWKSHPSLLWDPFFNKF